MQLAVVTGASAGIGAEFARQLRQRGYSLLLIARREDRLRTVAESMGGAETLAVDLADAEGLERAAALIEQRQPQILVNNAGFGTQGLFHETELERQMEMHRLHVLATVRLSRAALPAMVRSNAGGIINVASVASFGRSVGNVSYCATKAWMSAFSEGLYLEMRRAAPGVAIQALCPGFTYSEFHDVAGVDRGKVARSLWLHAPDVVRASLDALPSRRLYVIPDWRYRWFVHLYPKLPTGFRLWLASRSPHKKA
ncbi:MAG TPA: SDR family NAD(P)-dependent oxidoreductase [Bryobacteraceae bacterium]|nr:SDR family NAD(P)-dependent oxidoreductase [Bryobacteraceae bacterium]